MASKSILNNTKKQRRRKRNIEFIVENKIRSKTATHVFKHSDESAIAKKEKKDAIKKRRRKQFKRFNEF